MKASRLQLALVASLLTIHAHAAVVVDQATIAWSYDAVDSALGLVGEGASLGFVAVDGNLRVGAGPNLDPTATSVSVYTRTSTNPESRLQGIISDEGGGVDARTHLLWYATVIDPSNPNATGPVDITISGSYFLGIDGPRSDFNGAYDGTDGFAYLNARGTVSIGGSSLFSYDKTIGNDLACLPYGDPLLCEITISDSDSISVDATILLNSLIRLDLFAALSISGGGDGNYAALVRADPSITFTNVVDTGRYQIVFSSNLDATEPPAGVPEPPVHALLLAGLGAFAWATRRRAKAT